MFSVHRRCHLVMTCKLQRDTPSSSTQQFDFADPDECVQRAQNVSVPLPRTPEQPVPAPETPFQPMPHGNVAPETPQLSAPSTPPFLCFPEKDGARDAACGKLGNYSCDIIPIVTTDVPSQVPFALLLDPVVVHSRNFMKNLQLTRGPMIRSSLTILLCPHLSRSNPGYDHRDHFRTTSEHSSRVVFASVLRILNPIRNVCVWMLANEQF